MTQKSAVLNLVTLLSFLGDSILLQRGCNNRQVLEIHRACWNVVELATLFVLVSH
jgi:hypothetical protein